MPGQRGTGILQRLRARSLIIKDDLKSVVLVSVDGGMGSDLGKFEYFLLCLTLFLYIFCS